MSDTTSATTRHTSWSDGAAQPLRLVLVAIIAAVAVLGAASAQAATAYVNTGGGTVTLRSGTSSGTTSLGAIPDGTALNVTCQAKGQSVAGTYNSDWWAKTTYGGKTGYVSRAYVRVPTGTSVPTCSTSTPTATLEQTIIAKARSQLGVTETGTDCNPYGGCMAWCALFATWVWRQVGIAIPSYAFTGDIYTWGKARGTAHWVSGQPLGAIGPGDLVLYGTGPSSPSTSTHVDIVIAVYSDHLRVIGGNVSNKVTERDVPRSNIYGWVNAQK